MRLLGKSQVPNVSLLDGKTKKLSGCALACTAEMAFEDEAAHATCRNQDWGELIHPKDTIDTHPQFLTEGLITPGIC